MQTPRTKNPLVSSADQLDEFESLVSRLLNQSEGSLVELPDRPAEKPPRPFPQLPGPAEQVEATGRFRSGTSFLGAMMAAPCWTSM